MSRVIQFFKECMNCGHRYTESEFEALPTKELEAGKRPWPTCKCGNIEFRPMDDSDEDE